MREKREEGRKRENRERRKISPRSSVSQVRVGVLSGQRASLKY